MHADLLIHNISQLVTLAGPPGPRRGPAMAELGIIDHGAIALAGSRIAAVGPEPEILASFQPDAMFDAGGRAVIPGFVDPHTHLPWAGRRAHEFEMRIGGASYMQIMAAGGGIVRTVTDTRAASLDQLVAETGERASRMLAHGTTTAEAKTGYGLDVAGELKQMDAIAVLQQQGRLDLVLTFLGAHAVPAEYRGRADEYVDLVVNEMLPAARAKWQELERFFPEGWPVFCDVFCEQGAFDVSQSRRVLEAAKALGFRLKMHVDEFAPLGGTPLAVELGATSVDHIVTTPPDHVGLLARSATIGVALPGTPFGLAHHDYSPARALIDGGGALALATDLNPGTSWCENMQMMMALGCRYMRLLPAEALVAATLNAAHAIGLGHLVGSLEVGKQADLLVLEAEDYRMLPYRYGTNLVRQVIKRGRVCS